MWNVPIVDEEEPSIEPDQESWGTSEEAYAANLAAMRLADGLQ